MMIEILCNGVVHYRRPDEHPDTKEAKRLIESGACPAYSIKEVDLW